ncbi:MAG: FmdB family transcriptional regulator [Geodermatophilaceae bacterium]|nr:FmdB family transcriptional regulator [Geodermatophilaceae bacterium]
MPTYQYACTVASCGHEFDTVQAFSDNALTQCPECSGRLRKVWGSIGVVFKGSGFYRNDSREGAKKHEEGKNSDRKNSDSENGSNKDSKESSSAKASSDKSASASTTSTSDSGTSKTAPASKPSGDSSSGAKHKPAAAS